MPTLITRKLYPTTNPVAPSVSEIIIDDSNTDITVIVSHEYILSVNGGFNIGVGINFDFEVGIKTNIQNEIINSVEHEVSIAYQLNSIGVQGEKIDWPAQPWPSETWQEFSYVVGDFDIEIISK